MPPHLDSAAIDTLGGPTAVAAIFDIRPQAVSQWRRLGIPRPRRMYLELRFPGLFLAEAAAVAPPDETAATPAAGTQGA